MEVGEGKERGLSTSLVDHAHIIVSALFLLALGLALVSSRQAINRSLEFSVKENASAMNDALAAFRTLYTREVVQKIHGGLEVSHEFRGRERTIPLPATMTIEIGKEIHTTGNGVSASLYSPFPFPWRENEGGLNSAFREKAWLYLSENPEGEYYRIEESDGASVLRYATADVMRAECVGCHNSHEFSPKTDWKTGDVRGVLETSHAISPIVAAGERELVSFYWSLGFTGLTGLIGTALIAVSYRSRLKLQRTLQLDLEQRNEDLEQFAYRTSHDLKAPLTTMKGLARVIQLDLESGDLDEVEMNVEKISRHASRLEDLVLDILNLAKADLAKEDDSEVCLEEEVDEIGQKLASLLEQRDVTLSSRIDLNEPLIVQRVRLLQILENLIANGVRYSDPGKSSREVCVEASSDAREYRFVVRDNGLGIPREHQGRLFEMFSRFHPRVAEGSGLGMSIVQRHINALGGEIDVESSPDGTAVSFRFPKTQGAST